MAVTLAAAAAKAKPKKPPNLWKVATRAVGAEINPQIAALTSGAQSREAAAAKAITDAAKSYSDYLGGIDYGAPYAQAIPEQAAVDAALQQSLTGKGTSLAQALSSRLGALAGSSGAGAVQQAADQLSGQGAGAGNAQLASGSAELGSLLAQAAAAKTYGQKMPGIAQLAGEQGVNQTTGQIESGLATSIADLEKQVPGLVNDVYGKLQTAKSQAASRQLEQQRVGISAENAATSRARAKASIAQGNARVAIEQQNANTAAARAAQTAYNEDRSARLALARLGIEHKRLQLDALTAQTKLKNGGFTPMELVKLRQTAGQVVAAAKQNGYSRKQAINNLVANGVPLGLAKPILKRFGYAPPVKVPSAPLKRGPNGLVAPPGPGLSPPLAGSAPTGALQSIRAGAKARGLDPKAVLAIASQEGLGGGIGDQGTSFGPFQLHVGGAFPTNVWHQVGGDPQAANEWAWSPAGINYALDHIASVAKGLKGKAAVAAISRRFERPKNPAAEIAGALGVYGGVG